MLCVNIIVFICVTRITSAQLNGEFWWLNNKLAKFQENPPGPAKFEEVSEFETDETDKIVFRDTNIEDEPGNIIAVNNNGRDITFQDKSQLTWPQEQEREPKASKLSNATSKIDTNDEDILDFVFPDNTKFVWKDITNKSNVLRPKNTTVTKINNSVAKNKTVFITDKVIFKVYKEETTQVQNICTYLKKSECNNRNGLVYIKRDRYTKKTPSESQFICCILPLPANKPSKIYFPDSVYPENKRNKRAAKTERISPALKQRNALLHRKFPSLTRKVKAPIPTAQTKVTHKIVTPDDDYIDPYANIKNSNFKKNYVTANPYQTTDMKYDYGTSDYVEDYVVELPKPGLVGLYSDHGPGSSWTYVSGKDESPYGAVDDVGEEDESSPGYSTFDPRLVDRLATGASQSSKRKKPIKFETGDSDEFSYDVQSQTVKYQANPDFHVLEGFKLLNLFRNSSRIYSKNGRRTTTTERITDSEECIKTRPIIQSSEDDYNDFFDVNEEVFSDCGRAVKDPLKDCEHDKQTGEAGVGSHPWLALVVLTRSPQSILCYASLVHPRAAVTAADCVYGRTSPGEITLIAGIWDLDDGDSVKSQQRMALVHLDPQYKAGNLAHNLALLHWKRPLKLGLTVQPACVADPHVGDECKFVGWGGYDQAIRSRPRWQRASILTPRKCNERLSSSTRRVTLPEDTFCASIESRASVTGVGGPLTCNTGSRHSVVGVAIWRDSALVLLPAHEWTVRAISALHIH